MEKRVSQYTLLLLLILSLPLYSIFSQTTGKIAGKIIEKQTGEPLVGVNVIVKGESGTTTGAATNQNGDYYIINLPPGDYQLRAQMIGYTPVVVENIEVSVNRTRNINLELEQGVIQGEAITVEADQISVKKDQTSTIKNVSADNMAKLPVENLSEVVNMQAGIVNGHFRGGRMDEVSYMVDGIQVDDGFSGSGRAVDIETEAVQDLEVITGTFNAEYGRAMSGVVNAVTKVGGNKFHGGISGALANYYTPHDDIFIGLEPEEITRNQDYKIHLSGPIIKNKVHFFVNYRFQDNKNHLNGIRRFNVDDYSDFSQPNPNAWYSEHTGDSNYVSMNGSKNHSFLAKVSPKISDEIKLSFLYTLNKDEWHSYNHSFKYNPDGMAYSNRDSYMGAITLNHMLTHSLFYNLKFSYINNDFGWYKFKDPQDPRYVHDAYYSDYGPGFFTGGQEKGHTARITEDYNIKFDLTWQANEHHSFKTGLQYTDHTIDHQYKQILNRYERMGWNEEELDTLSADLIQQDPTNIWEWSVDQEGNMHRDYIYYDPITMPDSSIYSDIYTVKPQEFSAYFQDKMEYEDMVVNFGLRYDYFDPATVYPSQRRNPANQQVFYEKDEQGNIITRTDQNGDTMRVLNKEKMSSYPDAKPQFQISPRLGFSYQLGNQAVVHFSYGHFFQMPRMEAMYQNHSFQIAPNDYETVQGNPNLEAQKTVTYEIGLWQEINDNMSLDVTLYYKDIYDLLSTKVISTYNQIEYGLYTNKDYGNTRGLEIKYNLYSGPLSIFVNYTLQYTRGNADNPTQTFTRAGDSMDPIPKLIPLAWDQRHTLNVSIGYNQEKYGATLTGYYNSGTPYTWQPLQESILSRVNLYENNAWMAASYTVDLRSYYKIGPVRVVLRCYNLLDRLNENYVNPETGSAYTDIVRETEIASHHSDFNEFKDRYQNPSMYAAPRLIKLGLEYNF
ncbi:MAG: TonB-dependent receptor [Candidatus Marinimicrobia bacterium]|nr:TonB-dependent receptor [Candidatus Neomarinimicrobiota bacterium]